MCTALLPQRTLLDDAKDVEEMDIGSFVRTGVAGTASDGAVGPKLGALSANSLQAQQQPGSGGAGNGLTSASKSRWRNITSTSRLGRKMGFGAVPM